MIMKMHSYMATNGHLQKVHRDFQSAFTSLRSATSKVGGWDSALVEARARALSAGTDPMPSGAASKNVSGEGYGTPNLSSELSTLPNGTTRSYIDGDMAVALRKRLQDVPQNDANGTTSRDVKDQLQNGGSKGDRDTPEYTALVYHPDKEVSELAGQLLDLDEELTSQGELHVRWPDNISVGNFATYMLIPTLVYELEYPRTKKYVGNLSSESLCFSRYHFRTKTDCPSAFL